MYFLTDHLASDFSISKLQQNKNRKKSKIICGGCYHVLSTRDFGMYKLNANNRIISVIETDRKADKYYISEH